MIRTLVVEDERKSRILLCSMLTDYCEGVNVAGQATNIAEAKNLIRETDPELVFLDIQLAGRTAFELLDAIPERSFEVIFTTAYEQYALKAIKYSGIDYLLKPIGLDDLRLALKKAEEQIARKPATSAEQATEPEAPQPDRLVVPTSHGYSMLDSSKIMYMEAEGAYTRIVFLDGAQQLVSHAIGLYENRLPLPSFIRIHRSWLVNRQHIAEYVRGRGGYVRLTNGHHLTVSARKKAELLRALGL